MTMDPVRAMTEYYCVHSARSIAEIARKTWST